ncbi:hypothetical protein BM536_003780 [Streptomyces phaeoluteigriseus]|uniref:Uncharacterized protein n=1 Tax=Streptomyces phaeoluteigriseus TaxID=114686 RepID=A0A1V6MXR6_9ACTN|nr:hypothetical protein [Streptomyces phaeoluteigriseus]OQD57162.1 hypothetical protein BM536_003780 [Streptomyces phaeoluteigriseus]
MSSKQPARKTTAKTVKKPTGLQHRKQARAWEADMELRTYRPEQLLSPPELLSRFTERARELLSELPEEHRPSGSEVGVALRQAVLEAFRTREEYLARLVETDATSWTTGMPAVSLRRAIRTSLIDSGVRVVESADEREHFVVVEGEGEGFEVVRPAYVDQATGKLILSGQLRRVFRPGTQADGGNGTQDATAKEDQP